MPEFLAVPCALLMGFLLLVFPFIAAQWLVKRFGGRPQRASSRAILTCPKCESSDVTRLEADRFSPFPGYACSGCNLQMKPPGTTAFYLVVLVLTLALIALFAYPLWSSEDGEIAVFPFMFLVAAYSIYQILQPAPRQTRSSGDDGSSNG
ncbi:hypothetical protein R5W24_002176 [Gemmata sp. JC717]|uniref:hypothetical protein n=1 Tax=Gemmata algarum TaxID=2975278 RepID=UPI0021BAD99A|nr:hypothetical protein [Gemmata algarum]MDY3553085.1 hypothetical protein [Gemmata algarum]